ncbi:MULTISPECIES: MFS transporter [Streptomyces]|uniref:MFS transporter n=1 Tax=Streptomyces spinosisporus TaxID=2927582 RepID=A0ABS9XDH6_9ACTN|nr:MULTISPECIES: MFS transporter [Streptomyces]MCI3240110.1 MFS transporter [Streptomyces spinosisporus]WUB38769.1 MFS transporter [Streptomyces sp. NBC_00588]
MSADSPALATTAPVDKATDRRRAIVFAVLCCGFVLTSLDMMIVNVAFPAIEHEFPGYSNAVVSWTLNAYTILYAAALIPAGRLADHLGRKQTFLGGLVLFTLASALCAFAPSLPVLIAARALQALGAAALTPTSMGLLLQVNPPELQQRAIRSWTAAGGIAAAMAPIVGGVLVQYDWRLIFLINVPIGAAAVAVGVRVLPGSERNSAAPRPDLIGALAVALFAGAVVYALVEAPDAGWGSATTLTAFGCAAVLLVVAVVRNLRHPSPVVPRELLAIPVYVRTNIAAFVYSAAFAVMLLSVVLWTQNVRGYSAIETGLAIAPGTVLMPIFAMLTGRMGRSIGLAATAALGCVVLGAGMVWWTVTAPTELPYAAAIMPGSMLTSIGTIVAMAAFAGRVSATIPQAFYASGSAVHTMAKQMGIAIGVALLLVIQGSAAHAGQSPVPALRHAWIAAAVLTVLAAAIALAGPRKTAAAPTA